MSALTMLCNSQIHVDSSRRFSTLGGPNDGSVAAAEDAYDKACMDTVARKPQSNSTSLVCLQETGALDTLLQNYAKQTMLFYQ